MKNKVEVYQICMECAGKLKWTPVEYAVGMWYGQCDVCDKEKQLLCSPRDYNQLVGIKVEKQNI